MEETQPLFCHTHEDYPFQLTLEFAKDELTLFPLKIQANHNYHKALILSIIARDKNEEFIECFKQKSNILHFENWNFWSMPDRYVTMLRPYNKYVFNLILLTALHVNEPCISKFCYNHNILFRYHCIKEGKDYFSLKNHYSERRIKHVRREMSKIGNLCDEDKDLLKLKELTSKIGAIDGLWRLVFFVCEKLNLDDDDIHVYFKARSSDLFSNYSAERIERCAHELNMHPNEFRKRYWQTFKMTSPFVAHLFSALLRFRLV